MHRTHIAVLLVEDDPRDAELARSILAEARETACSLEWVGSLAAALERIARGGIDVVLLDLVLPDSAGLNTLRQLRSATPPGLPVVVMSGHNDEGMGVQAVQEGAQDYLVKGAIEGELLVRSMRYAIERQENEKALLQARFDLEHQVEERTAKLASAVQSLERENAERMRAEEALIRLNRELRAISNCNQTLLRASDEQSLVDEICRIVCEEAGYRMAWVGYAQEDEERTIRPVSWAGVEKGYLAAMRASWSDDNERRQRPAGIAIQTGRTVCLQDLAKAPEAAPWRELAFERGYQSAIALPLRDEHGRTYGAFVIYSALTHAFTADEIRLMEELAGDLAYGLAALRTRAERTRAEEALQEERKLFIGGPMIAFRARATKGMSVVEYVSPNIREQLGYNPEDFASGRLLYDSIIHPDDRPRISAELREYGDRKVPYFEQEHRILRADGEYRWVHLFIVVKRDAEGVITHYHGYLSDITERRLAEESLRQAKEAADEANKAKDQFFAVLSHELRTPLTPVLATVTLLEHETELSSPLRKDLALIRRNVELETKLIDDLLEFTRLKRGKIQLHHEIVDAHACLGAALQICQPQIHAKHLTVERRLEAKEHQVWADLAQLQQVFWNLLQNAAKFTPEHGTIRLQSRNEDGRLQIEVQDNGIGIEPAMLPRVLNAFVQAEQTKVRRFGGLGLGLTIAKSIMDLHGGQLTAFSDGPSRGATFTVEMAVLPMRPVTAVPRAALQAEQHPGGRILLVEDNPDTLEILARLLGTWGHTVTLADSVRAAMVAATQESFDLLVCDIGLPDGSGLEIMRSLKQAYGLRGIAVSGYGMEEDLRQSEAAGFARHLTKPLNFEVLQAVVGQLIETAPA